MMVFEHEEDVSQEQDEPNELSTTIFDRDEEEVSQEEEDEPNDLTTTIALLGNTSIEPISRRTKLILVHAGSMAQCRGKNGAPLLAAGIVPALLRWISTLNRTAPSTLARESIAVALASLRDLACGSAPARRAIWSDPNLPSLLFLLHASTGEPRLVSNLMSLFRNISHSCSAREAEGFHEAGGTGELAARALEEAEVWREASYRAAGALTNLCERSARVAEWVAGFHPRLVGLLVECWGGKPGKRRFPLLHLGLARVLRILDERGGLKEEWKLILINEGKRKLMAQEKERRRVLKSAP